MAELTPLQKKLIEGLSWKDDDQISLEEALAAIRGEEMMQITTGIPKVKVVSPYNGDTVTIKFEEDGSFKIELPTKPLVIDQMFMSRGGPGKPSIHFAPRSDV